MKSKIEIFNNHLCCLEECAENNNYPEVKLVQSKLEVSNFDKVKDEYVLPLSLSSTPCSVDAVYCPDDQKYVFIEFKSGNISGKEYEIRRKIYDSILILCDIIQQTISYTRKYVEVAFVYDESVNSRILLKRAALKLGKDDFDFLDLKRFEKYCISKIVYVECKDFSRYEQSLTKI